MQTLKTAKDRAKQLLQNLRGDQIDQEKQLRKKLKTFKTLTDAKKYVISANHNLKIILDQMSDENPQKAGILNAEKEKVIADTLAFLRSAHNSIMLMGQECDYDFTYKGPSQKEVDKLRRQNQLEKMIESRKKMIR